MGIGIPPNECAGVLSVAFQTVFALILFCFRQEPLQAFVMLDSNFPQQWFGWIQDMQKFK
jgi:hypothetical protein